MASLARPQRRSVVKPLLIIGGILILLTAGGIAFWFNSSSTPTSILPAGWQQVEAARGTIEATVNATGNVEPKASAELGFDVSGTVSEVLVAEGDTVRSGQPLARIDTAELKLQLEKTEADLADAQAAYQDLVDGATAEEVAAAQAEVARTQGQYQETTGSVTDADIASAQAEVEQAQAALDKLLAGPRASELAARSAEVEQAQAALDKLLAGPKDTEVATKQASLDRARAQYDEQLVALQQTRDTRSKAKLDAEQKVTESAVALEKAQSEYSTAYWKYYGVESSDRVPSESDRAVNPELSDYGNLEQQEAFRQAELTLREAELTLQQAQRDLETARQDEITGIQQAERQVAAAEAQVREAQADFDELLRGAEADELAQARANLADAQDRYDEVARGAEADELAQARATLASAQASLEQLLGLKRSGSLSAAEAAVSAAQAKLDELLVDPSASALARQEATVRRAKADVNLARRELNQATLIAPFDGTVATVAIDEGEPTSTGTQAITVADLSALHVEVPIDELDIASIREGQPAILTMDALPGRELRGTVERIAPLAERETQGTITYKVLVTIDAKEQGVRPGMSTVVQVVTERREGAVLIPRRAIVLDGGKSYVLRPKDGVPNPDGTPAHDRIPVTLGLSNGEQIEVLSGLNPGDKVLVQDVVETFNPMQE